MDVSEEELEEFLTNADRMRGAVISHTIVLERNMDMFICKYFCADQDKMFELMELVVSERMEFSKKAQVFVQILKKQCERNKKQFEKEYPKMNKDFEEIAKARNVFAHKLSITPTKEDLGKHQIVFKEFLNKTDLIEYTYDGIIEILNRLEKYSLLIKTLNKMG